MIVGDLLYRLYFRYVYTYTNYALMYIGVYRPKMDQNGIVSEPGRYDGVLGVSARLCSA